MIACIPPTLDGWVYIEPIHGPLDGPLYTWAQYTPTILSEGSLCIHYYIRLLPSAQISGRECHF